MNTLLRVGKAIGRCLAFLLLAPIAFFACRLLRPIVLGAYRWSFPIRLWLWKMVAPAKNVFLYPLTTRYIAHALIALITIIVSTNSLAAKEIHGTDDGHRGLLSALVQTEGDEESFTTVVPAANAQTVSQNQDVLSTETTAPDVTVDEQTPVDALVKPLLTETTTAGAPRKEIVHYKIEGGDTLSTIAEKYGISTNSILWANGLSDSDFIKPGQDLTIPPVSGVLHTVKNGDTLAGIAKKYRAGEDAILEFNQLVDADSIQIGQVLVIPGGVIEQAPIPGRTRYLPPQVYAPVNPPPSYVAPSGPGFLWPIGARRINQGFYRYHQGIDLGAPYGSPIYAADDGVVESVVYQRYGYGYHVVINHGGGVRTLYAHASKIYVKPGQRVDRGQALAAVGLTGRTTGSHLHFEVFRNGVKVNPFGYLAR